MTEKQSWFKKVRAKGAAVKALLEKRAEERGGERFSSLDGNPYKISNRNKRFSTYRSEIIHGVMLKPLDKFLDREASGGGSDEGLLSGLWSFKDDEDKAEEVDETENKDGSVDSDGES